MVVAETLAVQVKELASKNAERTEKLEIHIKELEEEMNELKNNKALIIN